jgi:hypothetical protein
MEIIQTIANIITIVGLPVAIISIFIGIQSIEQAKKVEQGTFLIELRKMFLIHDEAHLQLRNNDQWMPEGNDWAKIDSYLGLFELCEILIQNKSLSEKHFSSQYKYRLENILKNDQIVLHKLRDEGEYWINLLKLIARVALK